ncbi:MAG: ParB/RepB/Spo0J family partition protein [Nitrosopumilus sp.]
MNAHKYANLFPLMDEDGITSLAEDIEKNGLIEPIWTYKGEILDGRNRFKACELAHVQPELKEYEGDDPLSFVVALNLMRRHMTPAQRAMLGAELKAVYAERAAERMEQGGYEKSIIPSDESGTARDDAGVAVGVSGVYIDMAEQIKAKAPEIVNDVLTGAIPLKQARALADVKTLSVRKRAAEEVRKVKANIDKTKRIISDMSPKISKSGTPTVTNPVFSWLKDRNVTEAEEGWDSLFEQSERLQSAGQEPMVARTILDRWVLKAKNFVEAYGE